MISRHAYSDLDWSVTIRDAVKLFRPAGWMVGRTKGVVRETAEDKQGGEEHKRMGQTQGATGHTARTYRWCSGGPGT